MILVANTSSIPPGVLNLLGHRVYYVLLSNSAVWLSLGAVAETVTVNANDLHINTTDASVSTVVDQTYVKNMPLNGRSFLNLAQLQPGVTVSIGNPAQFNAQFNVSVMGGPASRTAITVDGGNIRNPVEGVSVALWGARHPEQLAPVDNVAGWKLDAGALHAIDGIIRETVTDPVGPEFMAPRRDQP